MIPPSVTTTRQTIHQMVNQLPTESLPLVDNFVRFVHAQYVAGATAATPWVYPLVPMPAPVLQDWLALLDVGYEGDALADTEAIY